MEPRSTPSPNGFSRARRTSSNALYCGHGLAVILACLLSGNLALASHRLAGPGHHATQLSSEEKPSDGAPEVVLDRLDFPKDIRGAASFEKHLRRSLQRQARQVDWGAGRENRIEYRFEVSQLSFRIDGDLLKIRCEAVGRLPGGQTAKSEISFGGRVAERSALVRQVLDIVARGVMTRLSEMERRRRGLR